MSTQHASPKTGTTRGSPDHPSNGVPIIAIDVPVMYEDEGQEQMGDSEIHTVTLAILDTGLRAFLAGRPDYRVFSDLNVYYHRIDHWAYVSPDVMVVSPTRGLPAAVTSYRVGEDGPAPTLAVEVLSRRSFQQQDLTNKPIIYADLGVQEYILADPTGAFMPQKLLIKHLQPDRTWIEEQDPDGGVTSGLGLRLLIERDGHVRVIDSKTGKRYLRPAEAQAEVDALQMTSEAQQKRIRALEEELSRLRGQLRKE
jgi:Uma2 family endonuclease